MNLTKPESNIAGGICIIEIALMEDLDFFRYNSVNNTATLAFKSGKDFAVQYFTPKSAKLTPEIIQRESGDEYDYTLAYNFPGITNENELEIMQTTRKLHILRITDRNGTRLIIPNCKVGVPQNVGKSISDQTGYNVIFRSQLTHRAPIDMTLGITVQSMPEDQYSEV